MSILINTGPGIKRSPNRLLMLLGGRAALDKAVGMFYTSVLKDPALSRFFRGKDVGFISHHFTMVIESCYGEDRTQCASFFDMLGTAHARLVAEMGLGHDEYDRVLSILEAMLDDLELSAELKAEMLDLAEHFRTAVLPPATTPRPA
ncbi:MAG: hypothetical protein RLZZ227_2426 [Pseudomonadota bacterium]|jgi:truncated hemoglobin YjbI